MKMDIWHITGGGFHFGRHGLEREDSGVHFPSDSLFAAVVARLAVLYGDEVVKAFGAPFCEGKPPFVLTSAFPRAGDLKFFPPPLRRRANSGGKEDGPRPKDLKRVQFVSEGIFHKMLAGHSLVEMLAETLKLQGKEVLYLPGEANSLPGVIRSGIEPIWVVGRRPHVKIGRRTQKSALFHIGRTAFAQECGLWFGVRWIDPQAEFIQHFGAALLELGDAGLGGDRSRGYGSCDIEKTGELELPPKSPDRHWITLGRYLPKDQGETRSMMAGNAAYSIEKVHGWVTSPVNAAQRRRAVNMLVEGSVLGPLENDPPGQMVDVQPDYDGNRPLQHPVWRNGYALAVGMQG